MPQAGMQQIEIEPNDLWPMATLATAKEVNGEIIESAVPIIRNRWAPATMTINKNRYPKGAVIKNEEQPPMNAEPVPCEYNELFVRGNSPERIEPNEGWPESLTPAVIKQPPAIPVIDPPIVQTVTELIRRIAELDPEKIQLIAELENTVQISKEIDTFVKK